MKAQNDRRDVGISSGEIAFGIDELRGAGLTIRSGIAPRTNPRKAARSALANAAQRPRIVVAEAFRRPARLREVPKWE